MAHSTLFVNGTRCASGRRQLVLPKPASAMEAPINFRKPRRDHSSPLSWSAPAGNSRPSQPRNSGVSLSSPRLRQYRFPVSFSGGCSKTRFIGQASVAQASCLWRKQASRLLERIIAKRRAASPSAPQARCLCYFVILRACSSVAPLAIERRLNIPTLFQRQADLLLAQL